MSTFTGGCYCGSIRYESSKDPVGSGMCHCRMCQRWTGAPAATGVFFETDSFQFKKGDPKVFNTSPILERYFCGECGTSLGHHYVIGDFRQYQIMLIGTLDEPSQFDGPKQYFGIESHLPNWVMLQDGVPQIRADTSPVIVEAFASVESENNNTQ